MRKLLLIVVALVVVALGAMVLLHASPGERLAARLVERLSGGKVTVDGLRIGWPFELSADRLMVADAEGVWLNIAHPLLDWHPTRLLKGQVFVERIAAEAAMVARLPMAEGGGGNGVLDDLSWRFDAVALPIRLAPEVLGEPVLLQLTGSLAVRPGGGGVDLSLLSEPGGLARVTGTAGEDFVDLRWHASLPRLGLWQRLAGVPLSGSVEANGIVAGRLPTPTITATVETGAAGVGPLVWQALSARLGAAPVGDRWTLSLTGTMAVPGWDGQTVPSARLTAVAEAAPGGRVLLERLEAAAGPARLAGFGSLDDGGRRTTLWASGRVPGRLWSAVQLDGDLTAPRLRLSVLGRGAGGTGLAVLDRLLGTAPQVSGELTMAGGRLRLDGAQLAGQGGDVWAAGTVARRLALWTAAEVPDLSPLGVAGAASVRGLVAGPATDPTAHGTATLDALTVGGLPPLMGVVGFSLGRGGGPVAVALTGAGRRLDGRARLDLARGWAVDDIDLRSGTTTLRGEVREGPAGRLALAVPELAPWSSLVGQPLKGAVEAVVDLGGDTVRLSATGTGLAAAGVSAAAMRVQAALRGRDTGTATIEAEDLRRGGLALAGVRLRLQGNPVAADFNVDATGSPDHPAGLAAAGTVRRRADGGELRLARLRLALAGAEARLAGPAVGTWGPGRLRLAPAILEVGNGRVRLSGGVAGGRFDGQAVLDGVPLAVVEVVKPGTDLVGRASGTLRVAGTIARPVVTAEVSGREVGFSSAARAGIGRLAVAFRGRFANGRVDGAVDARDGTRLAVHAEGSVPVPFAGRIDGRLTAEGDLARLSELMPLGGNELSGRLSARASIGGTAAAPVVEGVASLRDGRFENPDGGTIVTALAATATVDRLGAVRVEADGGDGGDGHIRLDGGSELGAQRWQGRVALAGFRLLRRDELSATVSGELALAGQGNDGRLAGQVSVDPAEVDIGRLKGRSAVAKLEVVEVGGPPWPPPKRPSRAEGPLTVALALDVDLRHAFIRGNGLDSEWGGKLAVGGTVSHPVLTGTASPQRGTYDLLGRSFKLDRDSTITFTGGDTIDPALAVTAEAQAKDITAKVVVGGTAKAPEVDFTSEPPLPRDEVMARLLFGQGSGGLSALQQIELGRLAAGNLIGGGEGGGFDPVGDIRSALGLDVLQLGGGDSGSSGGAVNPSVSAGKYIGPDTFVRVQQGTGGLGKVTVEQELGAGFSLESSVGQQTGEGIGLTWRKDY